VDWFRFFATDVFGCVVDPIAWVNVANVRVCLYTDCSSGCASGTPDTQAGKSGCCATGGAVQPSGCSTSSEVLIRTDMPGGTQCVPYALTYHY
jgi:hypothetical protein